MFFSIFYLKMIFSLYILSAAFHCTSKTEFNFYQFFTFFLQLNYKKKDSYSLKSAKKLLYKTRKNIMMRKEIYLYVHFKYSEQLKLK